ncbi:MAG TPA: peptide-methionine (S)-S-oxide reductase MsrA [Propionibacteriaceae bacterium]|nr:peptide-methionine (S)-S-oxide reductase MsrA [Propionibacteriaceae bacterium]
MSFLSRSPLAGRSTPVLDMPFFHRVFGDPIDREFADAEVAYLALGCFWGAEKLFWNTPGVRLTSVGYMGGETPNPTYREVCSGKTGHAEAVRVVFDPATLSYADVLAVFFENHNPTQGDRQGNDVGSQYRSAIYVTSPEQRATAEAVRDGYQPRLTAAGYGTITTEIADAGAYYLAEDYHQQYLDANPHGYCPIHATGVTCRPSEG